ncbi:MAG: hypothetical protein KIT80_15865 [Chitinophagaceae bacterium]|nr:hypothetical protein [Chitinophagaceae bacterium]MCW5928393.1 hypothetical protein [Chitinophagaceae bacterium]
MKWIKNQPLLYATVVILLVSLVSCQKENNNKSDLIELLSFGPAGVQHGEDIAIIGNNLDKVTAVEMVNVTIEKNGFKSQTAERIIITVPQEAGSGKIVLKTPQGDITSVATINFEVPVVITEMPLTAKPGDNITLKGQYMNWINEIRFERDVVVTELEFVSKSLTELVVRVPLEAQTGKLVFSTGGTEPLMIESEEELELKLPVLTTFSPNPIDRGEDLTITGEDLDLVAGVLFKGLTAPVSDFVSRSATEIVITIPEDANKGTITLVPYSGVLVESAVALELLGGLPPLAPLALAFYDDALANGWQKWGGWGGGNSDIDNSDNVRDGDRAIKVNLAGDWGGALQLGGGNSPTAGRSHIVFSIFGTGGTGGKELNVLIAGNEKRVTIVEGEWTEYLVPLSDIGSPGTINEFTLQDRGWSGTIYMDHIGLR